MASINPHLPSLPTSAPGRLTGLSPVKQTAPAREQAPTDRVSFQGSPGEAEKTASKPSSGWLQKVALGGLGIATLAGCGLAGGGLSPALSAAQAKPSVQVQQQSKARSHAPARLHQEQQHTLELQSARFGVTPTVRSFGDAPVAVNQDDYVATKYGPSGETLRHNVSIDRLDRADGWALYSSDEAELGTLDFHDQADQNWSTSSQLEPAGHFGKYVSVSEVTTRYTGGVSASTETRLRTIDVQTTKVVNLSELLSPEDYQKVAKHVQSGLNSLQGLNYQVEDAETLDSHMNNGFALNQGKDGKLTLTIAIPSSIESQGNKVAEFVFKLPASALN